MLILPTKQIIHINSFNFNGKIIVSRNLTKFIIQDDQFFKIWDQIETKKKLEDQLNIFKRKHESKE